MAAENPVESLQDEATCPVCLEYFTEPVTLGCGHNFCRACITQRWEGSDIAVYCPQCRETVQQRNLRQLENMVEIAKRLSLQAKKGSGVEKVCEKHQESLKLFCEEDQTPICLVCDRSWAHRAHAVVPIEEVAQEYKDVRLTLGRCEKGKFQQPVAISPELEKRLSDFSQKTVALMETLRKFKDTPSALERKRGESHGSIRHANVTLDPNMAHPQCILSKNQKSVRWEDTRQDLPNKPERFYIDPCVQGWEVFTSERHCWEVEVGSGGYWVARESGRRKGWISFSPGRESGLWSHGRISAMLSPPL